MTNQNDTSVHLNQGSSNILINYAELRDAVITLRAVNHTLRQDIVDLLATQDKMTVTDIYIKLRVEQSVASQHLAILRKSDIVRTERDGKFIYYSLNRGRLAQIGSLVEQLVEEAEA